MNKKYQIFISSTYLDLKDERKAVTDTILKMEHFPVGMELFGSADESQWEIIKGLIDSSDFYVLILAGKYGSVIQSGEDKGISYTEKEYNYALKAGVPILSFVYENVDDLPRNKTETSAKMAKKLEAFRRKVMSNKLVSFWSSSDKLVNRVSVSLYKAFNRNVRPGWIRATDIENDDTNPLVAKLKERIHSLESLTSDLMLKSSRRPDLKLSFLLDEFIKSEIKEFSYNNLKIEPDTIHFKNQLIYAEKIKYCDEYGKESIAEKEEVRALRYICKNGFPFALSVKNVGDLIATGVRIDIDFPDGLIIISTSELLDILRKEPLHFSEKAYVNWDSLFFGKSGEETERFISVEKLAIIESVDELLEPAYAENGICIFPGEASASFHEIMHLDSQWFSGIYVVAERTGEFELKCTIMCNEIAEPMVQRLKIIIS